MEEWIVKKCGYGKIDAKKCGLGKIDGKEVW